MNPRLNHTIGAAGAVAVLAGAGIFGVRLFDDEPTPDGSAAIEDTSDRADEPGIESSDGRDELGPTGRQSTDDDIIIGTLDGDTFLGDDAADDDIIIGGGGGDDLLTGGNAADELLGDPGGDVLIGGDTPFGDDDILLGAPDDPFPDVTDAFGGRPPGTADAFGSGLATACASSDHTLPDDSGIDRPTGILVEGELYGFPPGTWVWIQGPTLDGGEGRAIPIDHDGFGGYVGIDTYGDHEIKVFEVRNPDPTIPPFDLLPFLEAGPGTTLSVGPEEEPLFGDGCVTIPPLPAPDDPSASGSDAAGIDDPAQAFNPFAYADTFLQEFVDAHRRDDLDHLRDTLHPAVAELFGTERCERYLAATLGSIDTVYVNTATYPESFDLESPTGTASFDNVIRAEVVFATPTDVGIENVIHLPILDGEPTWLTRCGTTE